MKKFILKIFKRIIISSFLLYGYNVLMQPLGSTIPINVYTISIISILELPGFLGLIFVLLFVY